MRKRHVSLFVPVVLCLLASPAAAVDSKASSEAVEQLDEVEVTASRIAPRPHSPPVSAPEVATATRLPPDTPRRGFTPIESVREHRPPRLLRDDSGLFPGSQRVRYLHVPTPIYPRRAREMGWEGTVLLQLEVHRDGTVGDATVRNSSGHEVLDQAALHAAKAWRFEPQTDGGFAMSVLVDVPIRFDLTELEQSKQPR